MAEHIKNKRKIITKVRRQTVFASGSSCIWNIGVWVSADVDSVSFSSLSCFCLGPSRWKLKHENDLHCVFSLVLEHSWCKSVLMILSGRSQDHYQGWVCFPSTIQYYFKQIQNSRQHTWIWLLQLFTHSNELLSVNGFLKRTFEMTLRITNHFYGRHFDRRHNSRVLLQFLLDAQWWTVFIY